MAKRRRRRKQYWFPTLGTLAFNGVPDQLPEQAITGRVLDGAVPGDGSIRTDIIPLTWDEPREASATTAGTSLADFIGSGYYLRRIVGKLFIGISSFPGGEPSFPPEAAVFTAGFFIARATEEAPDIPVGASQTNLANNYNPLNVDNQREPWIWRRTWVLGNTERGAGDSLFSFNGFPRTNAGYGSVADGPHIDAKTVRKVMSDDRLYFSLSTTRWPIDPDFDDTALLPYQALLDVRLLGGIARQRQHGSF